MTLTLDPGEYVYRDLSAAVTCWPEMKNRRTYDFNTEPRAWSPSTTVRGALIDGWSAYYRWRARLRQRLASTKRK